MKRKIALIALALVVSATAVAAMRLMRTRQTACGVAATKITAGDGYQSILLVNNSSTPVFIGGSDVNTTTQGLPICNDTDNCAMAFFTADVQMGQPYCRVGTVTTTITHVSGY